MESLLTLPIGDYRTVELTLRLTMTLIVMTALLQILCISVVARNYRLPLALSGIDDQLVVDCRSSTYSTVWTPNPLNTVGIRVFQKVNGQLKVITHMSKLTRGEVTRYLVSQSKIPRTPRELHQLLNKDFNCRLVAPEGKKSWFIDVIV